MRQGLGWLMVRVFVSEHHEAQNPLKVFEAAFAAAKLTWQFIRICAIHYDPLGLRAIHFNINTIY